MSVRNLLSKGKVEENEVKQFHKYFSVSDVIKYIVDNQDFFMKEKLAHEVDGQKEVIQRYIINVMCHIQDLIDFEVIAEMMIGNNSHLLFLQVLYDQTEGSFSTK